MATSLSKLRAEGGDGLAAYILMQRIFPAVHTCYLVRGGAWSARQTISELGIFGAYLRSVSLKALKLASSFVLVPTNIRPDDVIACAEMAIERS